MKNVLYHNFSKLIAIFQLHVVYTVLCILVRVKHRYCATTAGMQLLWLIAEM